MRGLLDPDPGERADATAWAMLTLPRAVDRATSCAWAEEAHVTERETLKAGEAEDESVVTLDRLKTTDEVEKP